MPQTGRERAARRATARLSVSVVAPTDDTMGPAGGRGTVPCGSRVGYFWSDGAGVARGDAVCVVGQGRWRSRQRGRAEAVLCRTPVNGPAWRVYRSDVLVVLRSNSDKVTAVKTTERRRPETARVGVLCASLLVILFSVPVQVISRHSRDNIFCLLTPRPPTQAPTKSVGRGVQETPCM